MGPLGVQTAMAGDGLDREVSKLERQIASLENQVFALETAMDDVNRKLQGGSGGLILLFFGFFCALWAQNTGRSAWLWFFLGVFFNVFAVISLLVKNGRYRRAVRASVD